MEVKALSKPTAFSFLKGVDCPEISTPLENEASRINGFASFNTGTVALTITPQILEIVEDLRSLDVTQDFKKLALFVQTLQQKMPKKDQLFTSIVDPSLLALSVPLCETPDDITDAALKESTYQLEINADYALLDGKPVWERFEGERVDFYNVFKLYRDSKYQLLTTGEYVIGTRSLANLATQLDIVPFTLNVLSKIYHWSLRCDYYDRFFEMELLRLKHKQVALMQNDQLHLAAELQDLAYSYLRDNIDSLQPKEVIDLLDKTSKLARISVGLPGDKPLDSKTGHASPTLAIYNTTTNNTADNIMQINQSAVERQYQENLKDPNTLLDVLNVLQKSGAMQTAVKASFVEEAIDVSFEEADAADEIPAPKGFDEEVTTNATT